MSSLSTGGLIIMTLICVGLIVLIGYMYTKYRDPMTKLSECQSQIIALNKTVEALRADALTQKETLAKQAQSALDAVIADKEKIQQSLNIAMSKQTTNADTIKTLQNQLVLANTTIDNLNVRITKLTADIVAMSAALTDEQTAHAATRKTLNVAQATLASNDVLIANLRAAIPAGTTVGVSQAQLVQYTTILDTRNAEIDAIFYAVDSARTALESLHNEAIALADTTISQINIAPSARTATLHNADEVKLLVNGLSTRINSISESLKKIATVNENLRTQIADLTTNRDALQRQYDQLQQTNLSLTADKTQLTADLAAARAAKTAAEQSVVAQATYLKGLKAASDNNTLLLLGPSSTTQPAGTSVADLAKLVQDAGEKLRMLYTACPPNMSLTTAGCVYTGEVCPFGECRRRVLKNPFTGENVSFCERGPSPSYQTRETGGEFYCMMPKTAESVNKYAGPYYKNIVDQNLYSLSDLGQLFAPYYKTLGDKYASSDFANISGVDTSQIYSYRFPAHTFQGENAKMMPTTADGGSGLFPGSNTPRHISWELLPKRI